MDNYICVGKIINTFGIKGEVKIDSDFEKKSQIFNVDSVLYIGRDKIKEVIKSYRVHKNYDMIGFQNLNNINDVLKYKGCLVYIKRSDLKLAAGEYLKRDVIGFQVYDEDKLLGVVVDYINNPKNGLWKVLGEKDFYIPDVPFYIKRIDLAKRVILTNKGSDLII